MGLWSITIFSSVLNLDIFIISMCFGTALSRAKIIPFLALFIAIIQSFVPITGFILGNLLGTHLGKYGHWVGAILLFFVGTQLLFEKNNNQALDSKNLILVYLGAELDDLMAGVSIGTLGGTIFQFIFIYFTLSFVMNFIALNIGKWIRRNMNFSFNKVTGILLIGMGILQIL